MSMFLDQVTIDVKAGKGGDGMVAFRREKYVPDGGPAGGDGGHGGDVILVVDEGLRTLMDFRFHRHFKATPGENGMSKGMHGRGAEDAYVKVPPGTTVRDAETGALLGDLVTEGQTLVVARGGRGGRGNTRFASPRNPAPELAENGEPGQERKIELELKVLADVGLVGFPSVGKSTLLSVISSARPKIGAYHFTTLVPRVILHVIDMSGMEGRDPYEDYLAINKELESHNLRLLERPQIIVANKMDMPQSEENLKNFKEKLQGQKTDEFADDIPIFPISAVSKKGLQALLNATADLLETTPEFPLYDEEIEEDVVHYGYQSDEPEFEITREPDATWVLSGDKIEKLFQMTNFAHDETVMRFARQLRGLGVDEALRARGAKDGDIVRIGNFEFEFVE